jgi:chorismate mutase
MSEMNNDELDRYRSQIDVLDLRLLDLLNERTAIVECIGRIKQEYTPIFSPTITDL